MLVAGVIIAAFIIAFVVLPSVAQRSQNSASKGSTASGPLGVLDEIFHPGAHESKIVIEQLKERKGEAPTPGGEEDPDADQKQ